jgi:transcriptional regulator with XRE-family HTH domain
MTTNTPTPDIWWELRAFREKDGHSLTSLAKVVPPGPGNAKQGMSLGYLSDLENGRRQPSPQITARLAAALRVPVSVLVKGPREVAA